MGTGYVRQSAADIITGNVIEAAPLNLEFNQLRDAFHESSGHSHDGTTGEGPQISLSTSVNGILPVANGGFAAIHKINGTTAPTANDDSGDGYGVGSTWVDTTNDKLYVCVDSTVAAAVWVLAGSSVSVYQPLDSELTALAGLTSAANKVPYFTGSGTAALADLTAFARTILDDADATTVLSTLGVSTYIKTLLDDADATTARATLGAVIGTNVQAWDADLDALAALSGTNTIYYRSAANTWTAVTIGGNLTFTGGTLNAVASSLDPELAAIAGLTSAADQLPYFTGSATAALTTLTSFARTLLDDANAAAALTTLGAQPLDSDLTTIAGLTATTDSFLQSKASAWTTRTPTQVTADLIAVVGDSGSGGTKGLVPAPSAGDTAANKFLKADGTWSATGTASKIMARFSARANEPPTSNYATLDARNNHLVLDFDTTTQETAIFSGIVPETYGTSGLTVKLHWSADTATSGTVGWDVAFEQVTGLDVDADSFATAKVVTAATVPAAAGTVTSSSVNFTNAEIDGLVAGDVYRIRIRRDVATDTAAGDAELHYVEVRMQ